MQKAFFFLLSLLLLSCNLNKPKSLQQGVWRAELQLTEEEVLPFNFEVTSQETLKIFNAEEVILVDDISYSNDSIVIKTPVFEGYIIAKVEGETLNGSFVKESLGRIVPFKAFRNINSRFDVESNSIQNVSGGWEAVFSPNSEADAYIAKGNFKQDGQKVTGTFRTTTGDYRYLEGVMDGSEMKLSAFDGAHAFLFTAQVTDSTMEGTFYSGNHWKEPFVAKRNETFELPDENELTFLKEGYDKIEFSFPDASGKMMSLSDKRFENKVVLIQIMGTWCPNCLDESKYYSEYFKNNRAKDIEFVALAFEYAKTEQAAFNSIKRLQDGVGVEYPILLAQYGTSNKRKAQEKLPMLNHVLSYPTSIIIDKKGGVRRIHTGFNGPATGEKYMEFKKEFEAYIDALLVE